MAIAWITLVGFYRTYFRPHDGGPAEFRRPRKRRRPRLGERVLQVFREPGGDLAEDLGVVPFRPGVARRSADSRLQGAALGTAVAHRRASFKDPADYLQARWRRPARTPSRWSPGGTKRLPRRKRPFWRFHRFVRVGRWRQVRDALIESLAASGADPGRPSDPGRVRLAGSPHQPARMRLELDVAPAVAGGADVQ